MPSIETQMIAQDIAAQVMIMTPDEVEREAADLCACLPMMLEPVAVALRAEVEANRCATLTLDLFVDHAGIR